MKQLTIIIATLTISYLVFKNNLIKTVPISEIEIVVYTTINWFLLGQIEAMIEMHQDLNVLMSLEHLNSNCSAHLINFYKSNFSMEDYQAVMIIKYHLITQTTPFIPAQKLKDFMALSLVLSDNATVSTASISNTSALSLSTIVSDSPYSHLFTASNEAFQSFHAQAQSMLTAHPGLSQVRENIDISSISNQISYNELHNLFGHDVSGALNAVDSNTSVSGLDEARELPTIRNIDPDTLGGRQISSGRSTWSGYSELSSSPGRRSHR